MIASLDTASLIGGGTPLTLWLTLLFGTWVSEDLTCIAAGLLVAQGGMGFVPATLACMLGIFSGDVLLYLAGRTLGRAAVRRAPLRWMVREEDLVHAAHWFDHRGPAVIFASRFLPGTRLATYVAAGLLGTGFTRFALYFLAAVAVWTPCLVGLAVVAGDRLEAHFALYERYALAGIVATAVLLLLVVKGLVPLFTWRGRRLRLGALRRLMRWEFWSPRVFYPPVVAYVLGLALRHRGLTVFTAANPAMDAGGFIGEDKHAILQGLADAGDAVARHALLPAGLCAAEAADAVNAFRTTHALDFPVVLKPNAGQRGMGVAVVHDANAVRAYFDTPRPATIVQAYVEGAEFGIFYVRHPNEARGHILSITEKVLPTVTGNGTDTLERLILADPRAVCMARHYLRTNAARLDAVPAAGEEVRLVELGTHCRGAIFLDGAHHITPALEVAIDRISRGYAGFHFGRYDLRATSADALAQGTGFTILELNGVTAECTSIYDPRHSLCHAYRTLMHQWSLAFAIGAANRAAGHPVVSVRGLLHRLRTYDAREA